MAGPKKPADDEIQPEDMTYSTPKLDPATGAPLDTRFQASKEAAASKQSPKSEAPKDQNEEVDDGTAKGKEKPRRR